MAAKRRGTLAAEAREQARLKMAEQVAQREQRDREVQDKVEAFYLAAGEQQAAEQEAADAVERQGVAIRGLADLGVTEAEVRTLCGVTPKQVRDAKKVASASTHSGADRAETTVSAEGAQESHSDS